VKRLSESNSIATDGYVLFMLGSFAPFHDGHIDAIVSAENALQNMGYSLSAVVISPHGDKYVSDKIGDNHWTVNRRMDRIISSGISCSSPMIVDDLSFNTKATHNITQVAVDNISENLNISSDKIIIAVGSDNIQTLAPNIKDNKVVCVIRPGFDNVIDVIGSCSSFRDNICNLIITTRENDKFDINSTNIRSEIHECSNQYSHA